jgi:hypothetical protein
MGKHNLFNFFILFCISLISNGLYAQTSVTIRGIVTDTKNEPVIGVTVQEKATGNGTITNIDGKYSLSVAPNAKVRFSYLGYKPVEITVGSHTE